MPQRITNISVVVFRDGKRQMLKPNTKFDFSKEEIDNITRAHTGALRKVDSEADDLIDLTKGVAPKPTAIGADSGKKADVNPGDNEGTNDGPKPTLTAAQKKAQEKKADAAALKEEKEAGSSEDEAL